jgi:hypothetical protein
MKRFSILLLCLLLSAPAFAGLNKTQQVEKIEALAKEQRRYLWSQGATEVTSEVESNRRSVEKWMNEHRDSLKPKQKVMISQCSISDACEIFTIDLYYKVGGAWSWDRRWVLLNPNDGTYKTFLHVVEAEE